jgi:HD-like signal output (HDOD) protein
MAPAQENPLEHWTSRLTQDELPAMSSTVQKITEIADNEESPMSALADIILQDAAMTMHVLRLTDSAYHIPRKNRQNTVSRALVMLGVDEVKSICLSVAVFDPLLKKGAHKELTKEMAHAFHAAVQARYMAMSCGDRSSEEVFIAALLHNLGDMLFWCFGGKQAEALHKELEKPGASRKQAERKVLGFELRELTSVLSKKWGLGALLEQSVSSRPTEDARLKAISLSHQFVQAAAEGWNSAELQKVLGEMSSLTGLKPEMLKTSLQKNSEEAVKVAESYGAHAAGDEILVLSQELAKSQPPDQKALEAAPPKPQILQPDPMYQLRVLRELSVLINSHASVGTVLETILDGIYRGIGMDRALFALLSPNRKYLRAKTALGFDYEELSANFKFELTPPLPTIFDKVIQEQQPMWVADRQNWDIHRLIPDKVIQVIGTSPFFIAPTVVDGQAIGVFFADRHRTGRPLNEDEYEAFQQFALQANLALEFLGKY